MTKVTNLSKATDLVKAAVNARTPKSDIIANIMAELKVSKANAFVYFTKATKALDMTIVKDKATKVKAKKTKTDDEIADEFFDKAEARMKAKAAKNKVTELLPAKKAAKVKQIDAVVANMAPQSPFSALGV